MRKSAIAAGGAALVLALSACGGGGPTLFDNSQQLVAAAKAEAGKSNSSKFTLDADISGQKLTGHGEGRYSGESSAMSMSMMAMGSEIQMRMVDKLFYIKLPAQAKQMAGGKDWVKISPDGKDPLSKMLGQMTQQAGQNDPSKFLDQIQQAGTITAKDATELDGQPASHYRVDIDFAKLADQQSQAMGLPKEAVDQMKQRVKTIPMEVWLNDKNLPMQFVMDMGPIAQAMNQQGQGGKMTVKYSDWGAPVNVQPPSPDQIGELKMPQLPGMPPG